MKTGDILQQEFIFNRNGQRENIGLSLDDQVQIREPQFQKRCGWKANFRVHVDIVTRRLYCTSFTDVHNHELYTDVECGMQAPHRKMSSSDIIQLNSMKESGARVPQIFRVFAKQGGGYMSISPNKQDLYKQLTK